MTATTVPAIALLLADVPALGNRPRRAARPERPTTVPLVAFARPSAAAARPARTGLRLLAAGVAVAGAALLLHGAAAHVGAQPLRSGCTDGRAACAAQGAPKTAATTPTAPRRLLRVP